MCCAPASSSPPIPCTTSTRDFLERAGFTVVTVPERADGLHAEDVAARIDALGVSVSDLSFLYVVTVNNPSATIIANRERTGLGAPGHGPFPEAGAHRSPRPGQGVRGPHPRPRRGEAALRASSTTTRAWCWRSGRFRRSLPRAADRLHDRPRRPVPPGHDPADERRGLQRAARSTRRSRAGSWTTPSTGSSKGSTAGIGRKPSP